MASFDYASLKADVDELLAEFGQDCMLRRLGAPVVVDPVEGTVTGGAPLEFPVIGVVTDYADKLVDGETIRRGDRLVYIQATERPQIGDVFVEANGTTWSVVDYDAVDPAGTPVLFSLQLRR
ncbi:virion structural protein [Xanthomonas phage Elanor]|uniref:Virion structural protein n=1 Tax=Xanthomonas phage Elanor TaxID=2939127 RepID=A0A9E7J5A2_9CAUD|nr:virion structural protein [Xanthomonas phage Elanor]URA07001.1 virion structural protein [Xanthomonas phage Elanor]